MVTNGVFRPCLDQNTCPFSETPHSQIQNIVLSSYMKGLPRHEVGARPAPRGASGEMALNLINVGHSGRGPARLCSYRAVVRYSRAVQPCGWVWDIAIHTTPAALSALAMAMEMATT